MLVDSFYSKVRQDILIGPIFETIIGTNWDAHLPIMYNFWEDTLFQSRNYNGNPMRVHQQIHQRIPIRPEHFERWKDLFTATVTDFFEGEKAELARQRAVSIATIMQIKLS